MSEETEVELSELLKGIEVEDNEFIPKSKIRDKIKELEKTKNYITSMYAIGILEELLGDE